MTGAPLKGRPQSPELVEKRAAAVRASQKRKRVVGIDHPLRYRPQSAEHIEKRVASFKSNLANSTRACVRCEEVYVPTNAGQKYCSGRCYQSAQRQRKGRKRKAWLSAGESRQAFEALVERDGERCAICGVDRDIRGRLHVDHNHKTGVIRGLLCSPCNTALGLMKDDPAILRVALAYLERDPSRAMQEVIV